MSEERKSVERREFLRKAAMTGVVAAWAAPVVQTVAATPAFAQTQGTPGPCFHSVNVDEGKLRGCMDTCQASGSGCGGACAGICGPVCQSNQRGLPGNQCCNDGYCVASNWSNCAYSGPTC